MVKIYEEGRDATMIDDLENEIEAFRPVLPVLTKNFKQLIKKLDNIQPLWSIPLKKDVVLCISYINGRIKKSESWLPEDVCEFEKIFCSPLHVAALGGFLNLLKFIIKNTDLNNENDTFECLPIHHALQNGHFEMIKFLLPYSTNLRSKSKYHDNSRTFEMAVNTGDIRIVMALLPRIKMKRENIYNLIYTLSTSYEPSTEILKLLLTHTDKTFHINAPYDDVFGRTPLDNFAENGALEAIKAITTYDMITKTFCKSPKIPYGEQFERPFNAFMPIYKAVENGHYEVVKYLIGCKPVEEYDKPNDPDHFGRYNKRTPIHAAAENGHVEILKLLMETTDNANVPDANGMTPIHLAAKNGHIEVLKILMTSTYKPNKPDKNGDTPLQFATANGHIEVVKILLKCMISSLNEEATKNDHSDIVLLFTSMNKTLEEPQNKKRKIE